VRAAGGLYIADEVQTGFGRLGSCQWAFEYNNNADHTFEEDAIPDIVTLGKPVGNGMPLAAVVTTAKVAQAFDDCGVEYFNTFAGNPVCAAAGLAMLHVLETEQLQQQALEIGQYLKDRFQALQGVDLIGQVRGSGLFLGVELIRPAEAADHQNSKAPQDQIPATAETHFICSILRTKYHILTSIDGIHDNVFVIKPPMVFSKADADYFVESFRQAALEDLPQAMQSGEVSLSKENGSSFLTPT